MKAAHLLVLAGAMSAAPVMAQSTAGGGWEGTPPHGANTLPFCTQALVCVAPVFGTTPIAGFAEFSADSGKSALHVSSLNFGNPLLQSSEGPLRLYEMSAMANASFRADFVASHSVTGNFNLWTERDLGVVFTNPAAGIYPLDLKDLSYLGPDYRSQPGTLGLAGLSASIFQLHYSLTSADQSIDYVFKDELSAGIHVFVTSEYVLTSGNIYQLVTQRWGQIDPAYSLTRSGPGFDQQSQSYLPLTEFDRAAMSLAGNIAIPFQLEAGKHYSLEVSARCGSLNLNLVSSIYQNFGASTTCDAGNSVYWSGASDLQDLDGNPFGGTLWMSARGVNYALSDPNSPQPMAALQAVPEPASWAMLIAGFGLVGAAARQQRRLARVRAG